GSATTAGHWKLARLANPARCAKPGEAMTNRVDRRRFLTASAIAAAGAMLPDLELEAAPSPATGSTTSISVEETPSGLVIRNGTETVRITVCAPDVVHVVAGPGSPAGASAATPWMIPQQGAQRPQVVRTATV